MKRKILYYIANILMFYAIFLFIGYLWHVHWALGAAAILALFSIIINYLDN